MNGPWIRIEDGALLNLAQVVSIRVRRTERLQANEWEVVAYLAGGGTTKLIKGTKDTCERWRDRLAEQLGVLA